MTRRQLLKLGAATAVAPSLPLPAVPLPMATTVRMGDWDVYLEAWTGAFAELRETMVLAGWIVRRGI